MLRTVLDLLLLVTLSAPALGGLATLRSADRSGRLAVTSTALASGSALVLTVAAGFDRSASWSFDDRLLIQVDRLGALLLVFVLTSTLVVQTFATRSLRGDAARSRFFAASGCAATATATLVVAADLWTMAAAWVLVSVSTALLLRHDGRPSAAAASRRATQAFLVGDVAVLLAAVAASTTVGTVTLRPEAMSGLAGSGDRVFGLVSLTGVLAVAAALAAISRCALPPAQTWLPMSVAAPTPSSAVLHAGIVNGGGVILIRFAPVIGVSWFATGLVLVAGCAGVLMGSAVARTRADVKTSLAWSTVSQMGFMVVQCATGLFGPALLHMVAHGMYKSNLFLGSGSVLEHGLRRRDMAPMRSVDMVGHAVVVAAVTAATVGASWALVRPTSFEGVAGLVFLGFVTVTVAQVASTWLRSRQERSALDLVAFGALVVATTGSIALAAVLKHWIAPSLPEVEPVLASIGAAALATTALVGWCVAGLSNRAAGDPRRTGTRATNRAYLWAAHLGDPARVAPIPRPSEVRT